MEYLKDHPRDDAYISTLKSYGRDFVGAFREVGIDDAAIADIELFEIESAASPLISRKVIIPVRLFEHAKGIALVRWLVEHQDRNTTSEYRERANALDKIILTQHQLKISEDAWKGRKFKSGRKKDSVSATTEYLQQLVKRCPGKSAKELHTIAVGECDTQKSPFSQEDCELWIVDKNKIMPFKTFQNKVSKIRNP